MGWILEYVKLCLNKAVILQKKKKKIEGNFRWKP